MPPTPASTAPPRTLLDDLLEEQAALPAVEKFARWHNTHGTAGGRYAALLPTGQPGPGEQYAFEVDLDACTGCKACVVACHSLNGLGEGESWRSAGQLTGGSRRQPVRQTVTTACHHCVDPACAEGCPTLAYEKEQGTGIVRHLDDQCMGCGYCTMTCPYEVPQIEPTRGIVRKCDLCRQRLEVGEAPACVQACPNGAIKIVLVDRAAVRASASTDILLPTAPPSTYTAPTTRYVSAAPLPAKVVPDRPQPLPQPAHAPLVAMLILTQWGAGAIAAAWLLENRPLATTGAVLGALGTLAAVLHLGRPSQAWRAWMGWRKSWLSREILAFGLHGPLALGFALWQNAALGLAATLTGLLGVLCSGFVYHATRRDWWRGGRSVGRFFLTTLLLGAVTAWAFGAAPAWLAVIAALLKLAAELRWSRCDDPELADEAAPPPGALRDWAVARSGGLLRGELGLWHRGRFALLIIGGVLLPLLPGPIALALCLAAETIERVLFFRAVAPPRMPGWNPGAEFRSNPVGSPIKQGLIGNRPRRP